MNSASYKNLRIEHVAIGSIFEWFIFPIGEYEARGHSHEWVESCPSLLRPYSKIETPEKALMVVKRLLDHYERAPRSIPNKALYDSLCDDETRAESLMLAICRELNSVYQGRRFL